MELPRLQPLYERYRDRGFEIVAVEATGDAERSKTFIEDHELTYTFVEDGEDTSVVTDVFGVRAFPTSYLIDRDGRIMFFHRGFDEGDEDRMSEEIQKLL